MVVFDMAGTTVNENNVVYKTLMKAINNNGFDFTLEQVLSEGAGKEKLSAIKSILQLNEINNEELADVIFKQFRILLAEAYQNQSITEQNNATALFHELKKRNIIVALNTGYDRTTAEALVTRIGWVKGTDYDTLITATDVDHNRPQPDMIVLAMKQFNITEANQVIKVGDSAIDIREGKNAGCSINIGITTGAQTKEQLSSANPEYIIDNLMDVMEIIHKI